MNAPLRNRLASRALRVRALPAPEDVFLAWLLSLPDDADVAAAARLEIARLDRKAPLSAGPLRLRQLMEQAVGGCCHRQVPRH